MRDSISLAAVSGMLVCSLATGDWCVFGVACVLLFLLCWSTDEGEQ